MKKVICALGLAIASVGSALATTYPLTIENCGYKETFTKAPERVVADQSAAAAGGTERKNQNPDGRNPDP